MRKARRVTAAEWKDPVWDEPADERGWHATVEECLADAEDREEQAPSWVWGCAEQTLSLNAEGIITSATENANCGETAEDVAYGGQEDLQKALDAWCKAHPVQWWEPAGVIVVIDSARFADEFPELTEAAL